MTEHPESLEARLIRLEQIARSLEGEELELEQALGLFEEGVAHLRATEALLERAELVVEELIGAPEKGQTRPLATDTE